MKNIDRITEKLTSGKFLLTVIAGCVFGYCAVTGKISGEATATIITAVFMSYFNKKKDYDRQDNQTHTQ